MAADSYSRRRSRRGGREYSSRKKGVNERFRAWQKRVLFLVVFGCFFLLYSALYFRPPLSDRALDLAQVARSMAAGQGEVTSVVRPLDLLPGRGLDFFPRWRYPWLYVRVLSLFMRPFGSDETTLAVFTSSFFFLALALSAVIAFLSGGKRAAMLSFALACTSPVFLHAALSGLPHTLLACLLLGALLCLTSLPSARAAVGAGLIAGAAVLLDYDWFFLAPVFVVYAWLCGGRWRRRDSLCVLLGSLALFLPVLFSPGNPLPAYLRFQWLSRTDLYPGLSLDLFYRPDLASLRLPLPLLVGKLNRGLILAYEAGLNFSGNFLAHLFLLSLFFPLEDAALRRLRRLLVVLLLAAGLWSVAGSRNMDVFKSFIPAAAFFSAFFLLRFLDERGLSSPRSRRALLAGVLALNIFPVLVSAPSSGGSPDQLLSGLKYVRDVTQAEEAVATNEPELVSWYTRRTEVRVPVSLTMMEAMIGDYPGIKFLLLTPRILEGLGDDPSGSWRGVYNQSFFPELAGWDQTVVLPGPVVLKGDKDLLLHRVVQTIDGERRPSPPPAERDYAALRPAEAPRRRPLPREDVFPVIAQMKPGVPGLVFVTQEDYGRLLDRVSLAFRDRLDYQNPFLSRGAMLGSRGEYREALRFFEMGLQLHERSVRLRNNMGVTYFRMGLLNEAREQFEKALEIDPGNLFAQVNLGWTLLGLDQGDAARHLFRSALNLQPDDPEINLVLARLDFRQGDYSGAADLFQRTVLLDPDSVDASYGMGSLKVRLEKWEEAAAWFEKVLDLDPAHLDAYVALGGVYVRLGRYDRAVKTLNKAVELEPELPGAYYNLACVYAIRNDPVRALSNLRQALEKGFAERELLLQDPNLDNIRDSSGFSELLQEGT